MRLVPNSQFSDLISQKLIRELKTYAGDLTDIQIKLLDIIPLVKTGKRTPVISLVRQEFQSIQSSMVKNS